MVLRGETSAPQLVSVMTVRKHNSPDKDHPTLRRPVMTRVGSPATSDHAADRVDSLAGIGTHSEECLLLVLHVR
jgi:hypothetical protein